MFNKGFEKVAVSIKWFNKRVASGIASRAGESAKEHYKNILQEGASAFQKGTGMTSRRKALNKYLAQKTHDLNKRSNGAILDVASAANVAIPKKGK